MVDISLDLNPSSSTFRDVLIQNGDLVLTNDANPAGADPVVQNVIQNIQWMLGEWFLDITGGVPWFQEIFVKNPDQGKIDAVLLAVIANTPGITAVTYYKFTLDSANRSVAVNFRAQKSTGTVSYNGVVDF